MTLTEIVFYNTGMSCEAVDLFARTLPCCTAIVKMTLDYNPLDDPTSFAKFLAENVPARTISLRGNRLGNTGAIAIAAAIATNTWVLTLNLFDNQIDDEGGMAIVNRVRYNIMLRSLSLANNKCGDKCFATLIDTLLTSEVDEKGKIEVAAYASRLEELNKSISSGKKLKAKPSKALPPNIEEVPLLESVTINQVHFLKGNNILKSINLSNNTISNAGARHAIEALTKKNVTGLNFELDDFSFDITAVRNKIDREHSAELFQISDSRILT